MPFNHVEIHTSTIYALHNHSPPMRRRNSRNEDNLVAIRDSVHEQSRMSIPRRSQTLNKQCDRLWRILRKDLAIRPYKIALTQSN